MLWRVVLLMNLLALTTHYQHQKKVMSLEQCLNVVVNSNECSDVLKLDNKNDETINATPNHNRFVYLVSICTDRCGDFGLRVPADYIRTEALKLLYIIQLFAETTDNENSPVAIAKSIEIQRLMKLNELSQKTAKDHRQCTCDRIGREN